MIFLNNGNKIDFVRSLSRFPAFRTLLTRIPSVAAQPAELKVLQPGALLLV